MLHKIGIIGSGTMGQSIATAFLLHGYDVHLFDVNEKQLVFATASIIKDFELLFAENVITEDAFDSLKDLSTLKAFTDLREAVQDRDYVIECVPEVLSLKQHLFKQLDELCPAKTILASNTSSLPLEAMMQQLSSDRKTRTLICHWYNPAHLIPIVELSFYGNIDEVTYDTVAKLYESIGKQTIKVLKDVPGLVANRIQLAVAREVFSLMQQGVADPKDIDNALKFGPAFRYATAGQLEIADFGGLDIWATVGDNLLQVMDNSQSANPILKAKVEEGKLGFKTGEGFFRYGEGEKEAIKIAYYKKLITQLKASKHYL